MEGTDGPEAAKGFFTGGAAGVPTPAPFLADPVLDPKPRMSRPEDGVPLGVEEEPELEEKGF